MRARVIQRTCVKPALSMRMVHTPIAPIESVVVCVDFDKTITTEDTIALLFDAANARRCGARERDLHRQQVASLVDLYMHESRGLAQLPSTPPVCNGLFDDHYLEKYLDEFARLDMRSIQRVMESDTLRGLRALDLKETTRSIQIRDGCIDTLARVSRLCVVSSNWSGAMIRETLQTAGLGHAEVVANELVVDAVGTTTGAIDLVMQSPKEKAEFVRKVQASSPIATTIFIGDSANDLLAILEADVGIIMEFAVDSTLAQLCQAAGIRAITLSETSSIRKCASLGGDAKRRGERVVFTANSWLDVQRLLR